MNDRIIIVTGLPKSGTSMMMRMLKEGGIPILADNVRAADEDNPYGYYEFEKVKNLKNDTSWLDDAKGKAVKIITELLYYLPLDRQYSVIFMKRNIDEIIKSQKVMLERKGLTMKSSEEEMKLLYKKHLEEVQNWLERKSNFKTIYINYSEVIEKPSKNRFRT